MRSGVDDRARRPGDVGAETNRQRQGDRAACTGEFRGLRALHPRPPRLDRAPGVATRPLGVQYDDRRRLDRLRARCGLRRGRRHVRHAGRARDHRPHSRRSTTSWVTITHEHGPGKQSGEASVPAPRARRDRPRSSRGRLLRTADDEDGHAAGRAAHRCRRRGGRGGSSGLQGRRRADRAQREIGETSARRR